MPFFVKLKLFDSVILILYLFLFIIVFSISLGTDVMIKGV